MNEEEIKKIVEKEIKIGNQRWFLGFSFFLISLLVTWSCFSSIKSAVTSDPWLNMQQDQIAMIKIIVTLLLFVILLTIGWFYNRSLSKKLEKLWEEKQRWL